METPDQSIIHSPEQEHKKLEERIIESQSNESLIISNKAKTSFKIIKNKLSSDILSKNIKLLCYPSDPLSTPFQEIVELPADEIQPNLTNSRLVIQELPIAKPNDEGNYIYQPNTNEFGQVNSFYHSIRTKRMVEEYLLHDLMWSFDSPVLNIEPHAGVLKNAYYSETEKKLAFFSFTANGKEIHTCHSPDVICHENGHALLDCIEFRDIHNQCFGAAATGGHESFGDVCAILRNLHSTTVIKKLIEMTDGDLRRNNLVAALAEEFGKAIHSTDNDPTNNNVFYLRNAINNFVSKPYQELEYRPTHPLTQLGLEEHNYSRLLTGAFWDYFVRIYENKQNELEKHGALTYARDIAGRIWLRGIELGPVGEYNYSDLAKSFLDSNIIYFPEVSRELLIDVFDKRKILSREASLYHIQLRNNLPEINIPEGLHPDNANNFISSVKSLLNIPQNIQLEFQSGYSNRLGFNFLNYVQIVSIILEGEQFKQYNGSSLNIFGGVCLLFGKDNKLINSTIRLITDEDIVHIKKQIVEIIKEDAIDSIGALKNINNLTKLKKIERNGKEIDIPISVQAISTKNQEGNSHILKSPIHIDVINFTGASTKEYLDIWNNKLNG